MLSSINVVYSNELGTQALELPVLNATPKNSLIVRKVTGLNPPDTDLFIGDYARDGGRYQGRRVGNRNVVITVDLNPNPALGETVSGLRNLLYKVFMDPLIDADYVQLILVTDEDEELTTHGYTEKFETELFDSDTSAQISLICPDPYIRDVAETEHLNESGTWVSYPFTYHGSAETGFKAAVHITSPTTSVRLVNNGKAMVVNHSFLAGDIINYNTSRGERSITYVRSGVTYPLLAKMTVESRWIELHSVNNSISVFGGASGTDVVGGIKSLSYRASYWGV